jgi:hypothetical protein
VYLMKSDRYYKVGRTGHVGGRERDLAIQLPDKIITVHSIRTDDPMGIEAYWIIGLTRSGKTASGLI